MPFVCVDVLVDREGVCLNAVVLDDVKTGFGHLGKVDAGIVVAAIEYAPFGHFGIQGQRLAAVGIDAKNLGGRCHLVALVQFHYRYLALCRGVAYLREADVGPAYPFGIGARLYIPLQNFAGLVGREQRAHHKGAVLCQVTAIEDADIFVGCDADAQLVVFGRQYNLLAGRHGQGCQEFIAAAVVEGCFAKVLGYLFRQGANLGVVHGEAGQDAGSTIYQVVLAKIGCREKL